MLNDLTRWSLGRGNPPVPSRWQATVCLPRNEKAKGSNPQPTKQAGQRRFPVQDLELRMHFSSQSALCARSGLPPDPHSSSSALAPERDRQLVIPR
jgi:hypothetical protein